MATTQTEISAIRLLIEMETLRRLYRLYPPGHPALPPVQARLARAAEALNLPAASFAFGPDKIFLEQTELVVTPTSPAARLRQMMCRLGLAAVHLTFPEAAGGLTEFVHCLSTLHEPPGEDDRQLLLESAPSFLGIQVVPLDLSQVQLVDDKPDAPPERIAPGLLPIWAELAKRLGHDGAFVLAGKVFEGELTARALAEIAAATADPESLFDHLFAELAHMLKAIPSRSRAMTLAQIRDFLTEWLELLLPERRHLAVAAAAKHLPVLGSATGEDPLLLEVISLVEAVEFLLDNALPVSPVLERLLARVAKPSSDEVLDLAPHLQARARALLVRISLASTPADLFPEAAQGSALPDLGSTPLGEELASALSDNQVRLALVRVLTEAIMLWPEHDVAGRSAVRLAEELVSCLELGDFETAARITPLLAADRHPDARALVCESGVMAAVRAYSTFDREQHATVSAVLFGFGEAALPQILEALSGEENLATRKRLLEVVLQHGERGIPFVRPLLDDPRWYVVRNALFVLRRLGDQELGEAARARIAGAQPQVLSEILKVLVALEEPDWLTLLLAELDGEDDERRLAALGVAARIPHPSVVAALAERLGRVGGGRLREPFTTELIRALGRLGDPSALPALKRILDLRQWRHPFPITPLRKEAGLAVAQLDGTDAKIFVQELLKDRDEEVASAVRTALRRRGAGREPT